MKRITRGETKENASCTISYYDSITNEGTSDHKFKSLIPLKNLGDKSKS